MADDLLLRATGAAGRDLQVRFMRGEERIVRAAVRHKAGALLRGQKQRLMRCWNDLCFLAGGFTLADNAEVSGAGTASAGLPGCASNGDTEK